MTSQNPDSQSLRAEDIAASLPDDVVIGREIVVVRETDSTNNLVADAGRHGAAEGLVIFAETQRAGRGRLSRVWDSPAGVGLWFSVLLRPAVTEERWSEVTFCAALAVAETAEGATECEAKIKWPNDVLMGGRKIAGILLEKHHSATGGFLVVGIGINVLQRAECFPPQLRAKVASLAMLTLLPQERWQVAAAVLLALDLIYARWPSGFAGIEAACGRRLAVMVP